MALTPEDVASKKFTTVRLREGYDLTEVDQFLDEVQVEMERLYKELAALKEDSAGQGAVEQPAGRKEDKPAVAVQKQAPERAPEQAPEQAETSEDDAARAPHAEENVNQVAQFENIRVSTTAEASSVANRLLEMASRNADELVSEASQEADQILTSARSKADELESAARENSAALDAETEERRAAMSGSMASEKAELQSQISKLQSFEREYRGQLQDYFEAQLRTLREDLHPLPVVDGVEANHSGADEVSPAEHEAGSSQPGTSAETDQAGAASLHHDGASSDPTQREGQA